MVVHLQAGGDLADAEGGRQCVCVCGHIRDDTSSRRIAAGI